MSALILSIISLVIALGSVIAAVLLWRSARRANEIAAGMHAIEADRRHDEQLPAFDIKIVKQAGRQDHVTLEVKLVMLALLDEVVVNILDEANIDHWSRGLPPGITPKEADRFVWGRGNSTHWRRPRLLTIERATPTASRVQTGTTARSLILSGLDPATG